MNQILNYFLPICSVSFISDAIAEQTSEPAQSNNSLGVQQRTPELVTLKPSYIKQFDANIASDYITEGRDNLSNNGLAAMSTELSHNNFSVVPWLAKGVGTDYSELNLNMSYTSVLADNLELVSGYTYLYANEEQVSANDHEVSVELIYAINEQLQLISSNYYSIDAKGAFLDFSVNKQQPITDALSLEFKASVGFNAGYIAQGHNGINHVQFTSQLSYKLIEQLHVYAHSNYSVAINKDAVKYIDDQLLTDVLWAGIGMSYTYN